MSERTDMVKPAFIAQLKDTSRELSPVYEHSAFRRISHQSVSSVLPYGTWLCVYHHILQILKGKSCLICILWLYPKFIDSEPYLQFSIVKWLLVLQSVKLKKGILDDKLIEQVWQVYFLLGVEITEIISPEFIFL